MYYIFITLITFVFCGGNTYVNFNVIYHNVMNSKKKKKTLNYANIIQLARELSIIRGGGGGKKTPNLGVFIHCKFLFINHKKCMLW